MLFFNDWVMGYSTLHTFPDNIKLANHGRAADWQEGPKQEGNEFQWEMPRSPPWEEDPHSPAEAGDKVSGKQICRKGPGVQGVQGP